MSLNNIIKFEQCEQWLYNCSFSGQPKVCVNHFCTGEPHDFGSCADDFPTPGACCTQSDPAACLAKFQASLEKPKDGACATVRSALVECNSISGFATMIPQDQASCLCYNKAGSYVPSSWDDAASSCIASGSAAHPVLYSIFTAYSRDALGFCTKFAGPAAASATTTGTATAMTTVTSTSQAVTTSTSEAAATGGSSSTSVTPTPATASSSGPANSTTTSSSGATRIHRVDIKLLAAGLLLVLPSILMAAL